MAVAVQTQPPVKFNDLAWIIDDPSSLSIKRKPTSSTPGFHPRRSHKKSRFGCETCKRRHVKCSERRPKCEQCIHQRISCEYTKRTPSENESDGSSSSSSSSSPWSSAAASSMATDLAESQLRGIIKPVKLPSRSASSRSSGGSDSMMAMLQHFESVGWSTIGTPAIQSRMRSKVVNISQDSPFLLNAIFAFSANHLHNLKPNDRNISLAALHHNQVALSLYSQEMSTELTAKRVDAMIGACLLIAAVAFNTEDASASGSFIFSESPEAANWLWVVAGLNVLLHREDMWPNMPDSIWMPIFHAATGHPFCDIRPGAEDLPELFVDLCGIDEHSTTENNPYHAALRLLSILMKLETTQENFSKFIQFPCRMTIPFRKLATVDKDPAALLMMGWWFARMLEIDFWWCANRARSECLAVCTYLDGWPDWRVRKLLEYPMEACGYVPIDLDMIGACVFGM